MEYGKVNKIVLERFRWAVSERISKEALDLDIHAVADLFSTDAIALLSANVWAEQVGKEEIVVSFPYPVTWWDHFKRDAIPTLTRWLGLQVNQERERRVFQVRHMIAYPEYLHHPKLGVGVKKVIIDCTEISDGILQYKPRE